MFTREQLEEIRQLDNGRMEYHFACVTQSHFKRGTPSTADSRLYELYKDAYGKQLQVNGCKTCQYNNYTQVANAYYESKAFYEKMDKEKEEEEKAGDEIVEMIEEMVTPKKRITKKKTTKK